MLKTTVLVLMCQVSCWLVSLFVFRLSKSILVERIPAIPGGIYLLKVNYGNTRARCEMCLELTIKTTERRQWRRSVVFIVNFHHIPHLVLVFLFLTLSR